MSNKSQNPRVSIAFGDDGISVHILKFEKLSPGKLQRGFDEAIKRWYNLRREEIYKARKAGNVQDRATLESEDMKPVKQEPEGDLQDVNGR